MSDYADAIEYYVDSSRVFVGTNSHSAVTLHGSGGNADQTVEQLGDWFRTAASEVSSHFGIGRDGRIAQYVRLADGSAANCCVEPGYDPFWDQFNGENLNWHTISIEHINDVSNSLPLTLAQQDSSFKLIAWLCNTYNLSFDQVKTHASIAPSSRARCPGSAYPLDALEAYLSNGGTTQMGGIPQGWTDDGTILTADNGKRVVSGFRDYILKNNWDAGNVPLEEEGGADPVEDYYKQTPSGGTRQLFNYSELGWTSERGVYLVGIGNELQGYRSDLASARAQIAADQTQTKLSPQVKTDMQEIATIAEKYK